MAPIAAPRPIIIVDDDPDDLFFAQRALEKAGVEGAIITCESGTRLVEMLQRLRRERAPLPRVVFLDVKMPELNGFQTLEWIRGQKELAAVKVVMLTGSNEPRDQALARTLGATDYLVKYPLPARLAALCAPQNEGDPTGSTR